MAIRETGERAINNGLCLQLGLMSRYLAGEKQQQGGVKIGDGTTETKKLLRNPGIATFYMSAA